MNKYLFSVHPEWAYRILNGKKTMELRKVVPKEKDIYEMLIYVTKSKSKEFLKNLPPDERTIWEGRIGKVAGSVIVSDTIELLPKFSGWIPLEYVIASGVYGNKMMEYAGAKNELYGLTLACVEEYKIPKDLSEYNTVCKDGVHQTKKAPESWCRVEEIK